MTRVAGDLWCKAGAVLFTILLGAFSMPFANAADFRLRPDLEPHLRSLKLIYPLKDRTAFWRSFRTWKTGRLGRSISLRFILRNRKWERM